MKLWDKGEAIDNVVERFTVGDDRTLDLKLARYDALGSLAHAEMLAEVELISSEELEALQRGLGEIIAEIESGIFVIEDEHEDVHSKIEDWLTERIGEAGKKIHTARSRNDQVLLDLHLFSREEIGEIRTLVHDLFECLMNLSDQHANALMPGYTHMQIAMPSSFGLWFGAYGESLIDDLVLLNAALRVADQNPLGSAAGFGSSFPIDRVVTTELLHFRTLRYNAMGAGMSRGKLEWTVATAMASVASTLGRLAMDVVLYAGGNFGFVQLPDSFTTGSSIMPHKKNPDIFELIRARCNEMRGIPNQIALITTNLPSGYHRDYQILKEVLFPAVESLKDCLRLAEYALSNIKVNTDWQQESKYDYLYTVEEVNRLVVEGTPFREAYHVVAEMLQNGTYKPVHRTNHTHEGSIGYLCNREIREKFAQEFMRK